MSGHSKWATTKRQKEVVDAKRSSLFTKLSKNISIAARDGADAKMNFKLRMAIDKAKAASMPKENIERAVARGAGTGENHLEHVTYEGYGPGGVAVIVEAITDNRNRTVSEIKHYFSKNGGTLGASGSVMWMFDRRGNVTLTGTITDEQELKLIDRGLIDIQVSEGITACITSFEKLQSVKETIEKLGLAISEAAVVYVPKEVVPVANQESVVNFLDGLDELDDVDAVYTNADV